MNKMQEKERKQDPTSERKINLGQRSTGFEVQRERTVFGEMKGQKLSREIGENERKISR